MLHCGPHAASVILHSGSKAEVMVIVGGQSEPVAEIFDGYKWVADQLSPLPIAVYCSCLVKLNDTHLLSVGGSNDASGYNQSVNSHFYNSINNEWTNGPGIYF